MAQSAPDFICDFLVPLRKQIEAFALRHYYDELCDDDFQRWNVILEEMKAACQDGTLTVVAEQDILFHRSVVERGGLPGLLTGWATVGGRIRKQFRERSGEGGGGGEGRTWGGGGA